jgi:hypothetical protein
MESDPNSTVVMSSIAVTTLDAAALAVPDRQTEKECDDQVDRAHEDA